MTDLKRRMIENMQLKGFSENTQRCYLDALKSLTTHFDRPPEELEEEDIRNYFLHLINDRKAAPSTVSVHLSAIKFFYEITLEQEWFTLELIRPRRNLRLPVIFSQKEIRHFLSYVKKPYYHMPLSLIYSCGLRISEGVNLRIKDVDSDRMLICVRNTKGCKDRNVPLPQSTLIKLRQYYKEFQPKDYFFTGKTGQPLQYRVLSEVFKMVLKESGIKKDATVHSLRHSYATHLLENGVNIRIIQQILGHKSLSSTSIYLHLTEYSLATLHESINRIMGDL